MNLLVTNTRNAQAYAIIRALRSHSRKVVATMEGESRLAGRLCHAANSRLVDQRYYVPFPAADWRRGRVQRENSEQEEAYIQAVLRICEEEKIDVIFPSFDAHVYLFSKNKERFEKLGIAIPVPDYEVVIIPLDKYRTIQAAKEAGFPYPRTYLPESEDDIRRIAQELGFPLVIKPRFTAAGRGIEMVTALSELLEKVPLVKQSHGMPVLQEYIPGGRAQDCYFVLDKKGDLKVAFSDWNLRNFFRLNTNLPAVTETTPPHSYTSQAADLVRTLGWWGGIQVETKIDPRDGVAKLMEINPRLGRRLWRRTEIGINEPLMCVKIARGEEVEPVSQYPAGVMLIDPVEDMMGLVFKLLDLLAYKWRVGLQRKNPFDPLNPPVGLRELCKSYWQTYLRFGKKKVFNPYFRYFFQDPIVSVIWWCQFAMLILRAGRQLGK